MTSQLLWPELWWPKATKLVTELAKISPKWAEMTKQCCQLAAAICDLSIVVAFGHNELWRPKAAKRVSVTFQMLWPSATTKSEGLAAAKLITKIGKISRNGNTDDQSWMHVIR